MGPWRSQRGTGGWEEAGARTTKMRSPSSSKPAARVGRKATEPTWRRHGKAMWELNTFRQKKPPDDRTLFRTLAWCTPEISTRPLLPHCEFPLLHLTSVESWAPNLTSCYLSIHLITVSSIHLPHRSFASTPTPAFRNVVAAAPGTQCRVPQVPTFVDFVSVCVCERSEDGGYERAWRRAIQRQEWSLWARSRRSRSWVCRTHRPQGAPYTPLSQLSAPPAHRLGYSRRAHHHVQVQPDCGRCHGALEGLRRFQVLLHRQRGRVNLRDVVSARQLAGRVLTIRSSQLISHRMAYLDHGLLAGKRIDSCRSVGYHHRLDRATRPDQRRMGTDVRRRGRILSPRAGRHHRMLHRMGVSSVVNALGCSCHSPQHAPPQRCCLLLNYLQLVPFSPSNSLQPLPT